MKNKSNHNSQKATVASNKELSSDWRKEKVKTYLIYEKPSGKIWYMSTTREARDKDYRDFRQEFPKAKLGKLTRITTRQDLLKRVNLKPYQSK